MKKFRLFLLLSLLIVSAAARAAGSTFTSNGVMFVTSDDTNKYCQVVRWVSGATFTIPKTVTYNGSTWTVTGFASTAVTCAGNTTITKVRINLERPYTIPANMFKGCTKLTDVRIDLDASVTIGESAFENTTALTTAKNFSAVVSYGANCFKNSSVATITQGKYLSAPTASQIARSAFEGCTKLTAFAIHPRTGSIAPKAFYGCTSLAKLVVVASGDEDAVEGDAFGDGKTYSLRTIGDSAFMNCTKLQFAKRTSYTTHTDDDGTTYYAYTSTVDESMFRRFSNLAIIGQDAFRNCKSMTKILFPKRSIEKVGARVFMGCTGVKEVQIIGNHYFGQNGGIGADIFRDCTGLTTATLEIGSYPSSYSWGEGWFRDCTALETVNLPYWMTSIPDYWFYKTTSLSVINSIVNVSTSTNLTYDQMPDGITSIGNWAFYYSNYRNGKALEHSEVKTFGNWAFCGTKITSVNCPAVKTLGNHAFSTCPNLKTVTIPSSVTRIDSCAFSHTPALTAFKVTNGSYFAQGPRSSLMSKDGKVFIHYPSATTERYDSPSAYIVDDNSGFLIPQGVDSIAPAAFDFNTKLKRVIIPTGVKTIPGYCFDNSTALTEITIPAKVVSIKRNAFTGCSNLSAIYMMATNGVKLGENNRGEDVFSARTRTMYVRTDQLTAWNGRKSAGYVDTNVCTSITNQIPVKIPSSGYMTLCCDYDIQLPSSGLEAYTITGYTSSTKKWTPKTLMSNVPTAGFIPARTTTPDPSSDARYIQQYGNAEGYLAVVLKGAANTTYNVTMVAPTTNSTFLAAYNSYISANLLGSRIVPTYVKSPTYVNGYYLVLKSGKFCFLKNSGVVPANKAILGTTTSIAGNLSSDYSSQSSKEEGFEIDFESDATEATGIQTIDNEQSVVDGAAAWYTLDGVRLNAEPTQKGVYIKNGKKVVVK
ncbi:MAG: leucine-rich repeat protein [Prevotella sp.]|nr:leucine-rich repeat protein [Prevotella sp.]